MGKTLTDRDVEPLWDTERVAEYLDVPIGTLRNWAYLGKGPTFRKVGRMRRYRPADVVAWLEQQPAGGEG